MNTRILYTKPSITEREVGYATDAARHGWGERCYEYISRFESAFKGHLGVKYVVATSSCTGALHMGLSALGIGQGDEVILADTNWIATAAPIHHLGAQPVFVDVLAHSWCIDPLRVAAAITPRTKAIIATHLYGNLCEMTELTALAEEHNLPLIEDAAEALGSTYRSMNAGSIGTFSTFSFHGTKTLTTGEGGMFATNSDQLYQSVLTLSNHGRSRSQKKQFWPEQVGFKYKMSNIQAAIGLGQVERLDELVSRKRAILAEYKRRLRHPDIVMNPEPPHVVNGAWMPTAVFSKSSCVTRNEAISALQDAGIDARTFFEPLSSLPMFQRKAENTVAYDLAERAINLPSYHDITDDEIGIVADAVLSILQRHKP